ncbi:MAG: class II aldolase/adducin family protein [Candidatus Omnitrophota bacterium]|nr:class II aldolase/adducin family protein [Candidatus Omnitrophota bacterium]MBU1928682.1 class II aldolase/adducin family protein [Candidatus Omnitrophota bacterium]MBU2035753.1 class II aldolase/adducin family protein [Candidatus Omnitrophota bacterium]MBU2221016.1 class II aldolase/adducin family protein [Candidatus Omnitrophota bacterium]
MIFNPEKILKKEIIDIGRKLYDLRLVVARSGNLSARLDGQYILVTKSGTSLGNLTLDDIIKVDLNDPEDIKGKPVTSEFLLHSQIYQNFSRKAIIHCHPTLINAYFAVTSELKALTFEGRLYLGNVPVIPQDTPAITNLEPVIQALKNSNIVVIKNHGLVSIADKFSDALYLVEALEETVKTAAVARLFQKDILDDLDKELKNSFNQDDAFLMFSKEHIQAIVDLVNKDEAIAKKGAELDLTLQLAIKLDAQDLVYKFNFEKGKITKFDFDDNAPFIISAPADIWEAVFLGKLDPFVATTQGKMKLKGEFAKLSRWYVPFNRLFELFRQVKIK